MFELLDLFMRDSTLGVFGSRLKLVKFLLGHFERKLVSQFSLKESKVKSRLEKLVNSLDFVLNYYSQF